MPHLLEREKPGIQELYPRATPKNKENQRKQKLIVMTMGSKDLPTTCLAKESIEPFVD